MQKEITERQPLLGKDGNIVNPGYAKKLLWDYNRENIVAPKARIKEWDYYYIGCDEHALCLTVADMGYVGALSISVMDFVTPSQFTNSSIFLFPMGKLNMPRTTEYGDVHHPRLGQRRVDLRQHMVLGQSADPPRRRHHLRLEPRLRLRQYLRRKRGYALLRRQVPQDRQDKVRHHRRRHRQPADCTFKPLIDRYEPFDLKVMCMIPHQVFGYVSGKCVLDDGTVIELKQKLCFAEKVHNKW